MKYKIIVLFTLTVFYSCKKENTLYSLITVSIENTGINCSNGGQRIDSGVDENRNGILDTNEINSSSFVCNQTPLKVREYLVESNEQITKSDNSWSDYLKTTVTVDSDSSKINMSLDMSATGVTGSPEIAFRGRLGNLYSTPSLVKWVTYNALEKPHFDFVFLNVKKGTYEVAAQWSALTGGITTSQYQQLNSYNRLIVFVIP
jgi:hypothetical protein